MEKAGDEKGMGRLQQSTGAKNVAASWSVTVSMRPPHSQPGKRFQSEEAPGLGKQEGSKTLLRLPPCPGRRRQRTDPEPQAWRIPDQTNPESPLFPEAVHHAACWNPRAGSLQKGFGKFLVGSSTQYSAPLSTARPRSMGFCWEAAGRSVPASVPNIGRRRRRWPGRDPTAGREASQ